MQADMPMMLRAHPFSADAGVVYAQAGQTIGQMLREAAGGDDLAPLHVRVGGYEVPPELWDRLRPKPGAVIEVTGLPEGSMNQNWASVLMIAVAIFAPMVGGALASATGVGTATMWTAGVMVAGSLAVNALVKTPQALSQDEGRKWNELTGNSNQINPGGPIPHVLGEHRIFPPHAAMPYTVASGGHSYQYCMFDLGYNVEPDDVSEPTIGGTPISEFDNVTWEITKTPTIYRNDTSQLAIGISMEEGDEVVRTTGPGTDTVMFDIIMPQGFWGTGTDGAKLTVSMYWDFFYRPAGSSTWLPLPSPRVMGLASNLGPESQYYRTVNNHQDPLTISVLFNVPNGQYDIRVMRRPWPGRQPNDNYVETAILSSLLSIRNVPASRTDTLKFVMRIQADNQLNGTLQNFSVMLKPKFPVYNEATGTWTRLRTTNAGWLYHYLLTSSPATIRKVSPDRMHLDQILDFVDFNERHDLECRMVVDTATTVGQVVDMLLRSSGGERTMTDGKYGVTFLPDSVPLASVDYAPTEVADFSLSRTFANIPNALRVKFRNPLADWQDDELMVLDDGYSYRGLDARGNPSSLPEPETFETLDLQATMLPEQAWRLGRMHFAQAKFSAATYTWRTDVAGLKMTKGTPVTVAHDVPQWGVGAGRIVSLTAGGPTGVATLVLDAEVETDPAKSYRMQIRGPNGTQAVNCTPHSPRTATFYLHAMPSGVQAGDVGILGDTAIEKPLLLVTSMRGNKDLDFEVAAVAWDARIAPFWADPPDNLVSEISGRAYTEPPDPPTVTVGTGEDTDDAGIRNPTLNIGHWDTGGKFERPYAVQVQ